MNVTALGHLYVETHDWDQSVGFWTGLGFSFSTRWGSEGHRAGRLESGQAIVVLAEVAVEQAPAFYPFFTLEDPDTFEMTRDVDVVTPLEDTHWGTRWIRVRDPEGRIHCFETAGEPS